MHLSLSTLTLVGLSLAGAVIALPEPIPEKADVKLNIEARQAESFPGVYFPPHTSMK